MKWPEPRRFNVDLANGLMLDTGALYQKRLRDLEGLYSDKDAFEKLVNQKGNEVVYEVTNHIPSNNSGDIITGVTRMSPGLVGEEYFMTRGHIHANADRPELYYGLKGTGLMLMESPDGETKVIEIQPNTACYVPPFWIHRSVNVGNEDFVMLFCYPSDSGQDYGIIERSNGMRMRIVKGETSLWVTQENPLYRPRSEEEVQSLAALL